MNIISRALNRIPSPAAIAPVVQAQPVWTKKTYLRVKIKSLAAEAKIIRLEERKWVTKDGRKDHPIRIGLNAHRRHDVRKEQRSALLAYGFLRGRAYKRIESKCHAHPDIERVIELVRKYGPINDRGPVLAAIKEWWT